ncbi:Rieske (2Fe-2S) protein [Streptomyces boluensis]|uniref:Cytochrome bc1 complex Rieske iron-sulfur subunit n=1 Tax=Streptomyces boluensis TaxID=1775135 RepID=A0A964UVL0_9ACTN|nr:Rieske (2Fe-2S) protein [Streptomyces boluensis]NBE55033.1 Rieske 2Fe-2S domain-containing protein [Streptomyces boluensis]
MANSQDTGSLDPARRTVVAGVGAVGLAAAVTACGGSGDSTPAGETSPPKDATGGADTGAPTDGETGGGGGGGTPLAKTGDIPEGGGKVFKEEGVVVTQPSAGDFKAFSATCTHQGCTVKDVADGTINCVCHGSKFAVADGSVEHGPATRPLPTAKIAVSGDEITLP